MLINEFYDVLAFGKNSWLQHPILVMNRLFLSITVHATAIVMWLIPQEPCLEPLKLFEHEHLLFQSRCHSLKHTVKFWVVFIVLECSSSWSSLSVSFCGSLSVADCFSCQCASWTVVWWWTRFLMHVDQFWTHSGLPKTPYLYLFCSGFGCGSQIHNEQFGRD